MARHPANNNRRLVFRLIALVLSLLAATIYRCSQPEGARRETARPESVRSAARPAPRPAAAFDFYLLDLTHEAAWCEDGHARGAQCRAVDRDTANKQPLVLHGLWPENEAPGAYPSNCSAGALRLSPALRQRLNQVMPGTIEGLDEHEWRKHGGCTGLDAETYFADAVQWTERLSRALSPPLRQAAGRQTSAATLRAAIGATDAALADGVVFICKNLASANPRYRQRPYLISVRACIDNDGEQGRPGSLLNCASVQRRDQGCGRGFFIDDIEE